MTILPNNKRKAAALSNANSNMNGFQNHVAIEKHDSLMHLAQQSSGGIPRISSTSSQYSINHSLNTENLPDIYHRTYSSINAAANGNQNNAAQQTTLGNNSIEFTPFSFDAGMGILSQLHSQSQHDENTGSNRLLMRVPSGLLDQNLQINTQNSMFDMHWTSVLAGNGIVDKNTVQPFSRSDSNILTEEFSGMQRTLIVDGGIYQPDSEHEHDNQEDSESESNPRAVIVPNPSANDLSLIVKGNNLHRRGKVALIPISDGVKEEEELSKGSKGHNLRPRRANKQYVKPEYSFLMDTDEDEDDTHFQMRRHTTKLKHIASTNIFPTVKSESLKDDSNGEEGEEDDTDDSDDDSISRKVSSRKSSRASRATTAAKTEEADDNEVDQLEEGPVRKKRAYYRRGKHPKEVIERVEAQRLVLKRIKNRELAAKSRKRKKEKMSLLEKENKELKIEIKRLREKNSKCTCSPANASLH